MSSISERLLARGASANIEALHGERIDVLTGQDIGLSFRGVVEIETDVRLGSDLSDDPRGKRVVRFRNGSVPRLSAHDRIRTEDGKTWNAIKQNFGSFLTTEFELREIVAGKDI